MTPKGGVAPLQRPEEGNDNNQSWERTISKGDWMHWGCLLQRRQTKRGGIKTVFRNFKAFRWKKTYENSLFCIPMASTRRKVGTAKQEIKVRSHLWDLVVRTFKHLKRLPLVAETPPFESVLESARQTCQETPEYSRSGLWQQDEWDSPHQVTSSHLVVKSLSLSQNTNPHTILSSQASLADIRVTKSKLECWCVCYHAM